MWPFTRSIPAPDELTVEKGTKCIFVLDVENLNRTGKIWNEKGDLLWHYAPRSNPLGYSLRNPFNKPDFVLFDKKEQSVIAIRRMSFVPSRFQVIADEIVVGHIALRSPLLNKYSIDIDGLATCVFRMPLFTLCFHGRFNKDTKIWVVVGPSKMQWSVLAHSTVDDIRLLAALAFIHNQWYNHC